MKKTRKEKPPIHNAATHPMIEEKEKKKHELIELTPPHSCPPCDGSFDEGEMALQSLTYHNRERGRGRERERERKQYYLN